MKFIVSQDGQQIFTISKNNLINIAPLEILDEKKTIYSVGIQGISFGVFESIDTAKKVIIGISNFLCNDRYYFAIPKDRGDGAGEYRERI